MSKTAIVFGCDGSDNIQEVNSALTGGGVEILSGDEKTALDNADFLVLVASEAQKLADGNIEDKWSYFLDEIKWKRKKSGEVLIVDTSEISFAPSRLAYALKKCRRFRLSQLSDMIEYIVSGDVSEPEPPKATVVQPPVVPAPKRESGACKEDHIFGKDSGHKSYVRDEKEGVCKDDHVFEEEIDDEADIETEEIDDDKYVIDENDLKYSRAKPYESPFEGYPDEEKKKPATGGVKGRFGAVTMFVIFIIAAIAMFTVFRVCSAFAGTFFESVSVRSVNNIVEPVIGLFGL